MVTFLVQEVLGRVPNYSQGGPAVHKYTPPPQGEWEWGSSLAPEASEPRCPPGGLLSNRLSYTQSHTATQSHTEPHSATQTSLEEPHRGTRTYTQLHNRTQLGRPSAQCRLTLSHAAPLRAMHGHAVPHRTTTTTKEYDTTHSYIHT